MTDLRRIWSSWKNIHGLDHAIESVAEYLEVLDKYRCVHGSFTNAIFRGEGSLYDSVNGNHDTYLISRVARRAVEAGSQLGLYRRGASQELSPLNISAEEVEALEAFKGTSKIDGIAPYSAAWLGLAQHYGADTRMLDFSRDPLVGLFFACFSATEGFNSEDGVVFMLLPNSLRTQSQERSRVGPGDIEQGLPSSYFEAFEPWALSDVYPKTPHSYQPPAVDVSMNQRLAAQRGLFVWWHPATERMAVQNFPILISGSHKPDILRELGRMGTRPDALFPDDEGAQYQSTLDGALSPRSVD